MNTHKKVIVFGATGSVGRHLVQQHLEAGHTVTAFCRNPSKLNIQDHPRLKVVTGDVFQAADVKQAVAGQEVVIVTLGSGKSRKGNVRSEGTRNVIAAMQAQGVRRLICQTTLGTGDSRGNLNFFWKRIMFGWYLKQVFLDHELQESYVRESGLDWTIVRPAAFTDGDRLGEYRHGFASTARKLTLKISRADVADFILQQVQSDAYLHQSPGLSY